MQTQSLTRALGRLEDVLLDAAVLEAVLARREAGVARAADPGHADALATELSRFQSSDGSWGASLARSAEALLLLHALTPEPPDVVRSSVERGCDWIAAQASRPGAFGEGCAAVRHEAGLCSHALRGFFSPSPPEVDLSGLTLATPARFGSDADARLGASCVALRAMLLWGRSDAPVGQQGASLQRLAEGGALLHQQPPVIAGFVAAIGALVENSPPAASRRDEVGVRRSTHAADVGLRQIMALQRADGSWPAADTFQVLDLLLRASERGLGSEAMDAAILRAVEMLALLQRVDGSWGRETGPERMLIGWRALRHALRLR